MLGLSSDLWAGVATDELFNEGKIENTEEKAYWRKSSENSRDASHLLC